MVDNTHKELDREEFMNDKEPVAGENELKPNEEERKNKEESNEDPIEIYRKALQKLWHKKEPIIKKRIKDIKILLIDDQSSMRTIIRNILNEIGFSIPNIDEAADGEKAIMKLKKMKYDLIISDWNMPNMTGIDLLRIVKSAPGLKDIPFLMATAEGQKSKVLEAIKEGVDNYIVKPFSPEQMKDKLKFALKKIAK